MINIAREGGNKRKKKIVFFSLLSSLLPLLFLISCNKNSHPYVEIITQNNKTIKVNVEIADTPGTREQGLMYRDSLPEDSGMLFFMPEEKEQIFWMKDTRIPLDIIFIFSDWKIAGIAENTKTYSTDPITINKPSKYVLEVNAGFCKKYGIQSGDKIVYHPVE